MSVLEGPQSALAPAGREAGEIAQTAWMLFGGAAAIFVVVMALAAVALLRAPRWLSGRGVVVGGGIVFPLVVLTALLVDSLLASPRPFVASSRPGVVVRVVGEQWWWRVEYLDAQGRRDFATANEIRIPAGSAIELRLESADVLHSFWVPPLAGKLDLIPGRTNRLVLVADRAGAWRGQCAEFCGGAHAKMALHVVALPAGEFEQWRVAQRGEARAHAAPGRSVLESRCAVCHTVRGTAAAGVRGPDLTHLASRTSIGGGILPNDAASIERWIVSNQALKPGNLMPEFRDLAPAELRALIGYLATLE